MQTTTAPTDYRGALLESKSEVLTNLGVKFNTLASFGRVNEEDQAQLSHDEFLNLRLNSLDYSKLRLVDEALTRLDDGEYGICQGCDEAIPPRRLQVIPWAKYCVNCQETLGQQQALEEDPVAMFAHFAHHH